MLFFRSEKKQRVVRRYNVIVFICYGAAFTAAYTDAYTAAYNDKHSSTYTVVLRSRMITGGQMCLRRICIIKLQTVSNAICLDFLFKIYRRRGLLLRSVFFCV